MALVKLQGEKEKQQGIFYEFDTASEPLGEGGMGKVYRGRRINVHTNEKRDVAIKFMFETLPASVIDRARREANIIIHHPNLIEMMGFLTVDYPQPDGKMLPRYHVVSEYLQGVSLSDLIQGVVTDQYGKPIPYAQELYSKYNSNPEQFAVDIMKKLLSGIMALHDAGYMHRDIDPSNIMITADRKIKIIDFGIAKRIDGLVTHDKNLTTAGVFMGKPQYAAPELVIGDIHSQNKQTDIYALGILMYQLVVGHLPFEGPANVVLDMHMHQKMPLEAIKDKGLRKIIAHATEKNPLMRYQSASEFRVDQDNWSPTDPPRIPWKQIITIGISVIAVLCIVIICIVLSRQAKDPQPEPQPKPEQEVEVVETINADNIRKHLAEGSDVEANFKKLGEMADNKDKDAMFLLSQIYTKTQRSFPLDPDIVTIQANLSGVVKTDAKKAHDLLKQIVELDNTYYPALYELARNYFVGTDLTGGEASDLIKAKTLAMKAKQYAEKANAPAYIQKANSLLEFY